MGQALEAGSPPADEEEAGEDRAADPQLSASGTGTSS
jgi:hypothetical protein